MKTKWWVSTQPPKHPFHLLSNPAFGEARCFTLFFHAPSILHPQVCFYSIRRERCSAAKPIPSPTAGRHVDHLLPPLPVRARAYACPANSAVRRKGHPSGLEDMFTPSPHRRLAGYLHGRQICIQLSRCDLYRLFPPPNVPLFG